MNKNYGKWFLTKVKKAVIDYDMIQNNDHIAVGISGGKDSLALLFILDTLKKYSSLSFDITAVTIDLGWNMDFEPIKKLCNELKIPYKIVQTYIGKIVFDVRKEKNPCSLCSKMRRGALDNAAKELGANKVALGHHADDIIETLFLNLIFTARFSTFDPKTFLSRKKITIIRPLIYLDEKTVSSIASYKKLPVIQNLCPASNKTKRHDIKQLVTHANQIFPRARQNLITALKKQKFFTKN